MLDDPVKKFMSGFVPPPSSQSTPTGWSLRFVVGSTCILLAQTLLNDNLTLHHTRAVKPRSKVHVLPVKVPLVKDAITLRRGARNLVASSIGQRDYTLNKEQLSSAIILAISLSSVVVTDRLAAGPLSIG